jgi:putative hemolysin
MEDTQANRKFKPIVIKELFMDKNPRMAKMIPGFIYGMLRRALELDYTNEILQEHGHRQGVDFADTCIKKFNVTIKVKGAENLPADGKNIFVSNHPLGGFDGVLILRELANKYSDVKFFVNDILLYLTNMEEVFIPINKHGAQAMENVRRIDRIYSSDSQVVTFPAGLVSRRIRGVIMDTTWQKNFIVKAVNYQRDIVPMHITGRCRNYFYNLSNLRKFLGIKANLEMFFLPKETYQHKNTEYTITYGKPISWEVFDKHYKPIEWAEKVKQHCYSLPGDRNRLFKAE